MLGFPLPVGPTGTEPQKPLCRGVTVIKWAVGEATSSPGRTMVACSMDGLTRWHVSVWKLSLPQDLEEDTQLSDKGEEVGVPCTARLSPSPETPGLESLGPLRTLAHPQHTKLCDLLCLSSHTTPRTEKLRQGVAVVKG